ncbi:hypothetical protein Godav_023359 [Gossypium davidsonii]|uniref:Uncharacterized protein n=1 Tax=Gossypium davidsonii TaxID=34287 RepID=A0A7J8SSX3_GOSDV|nr:hypothetical protein [Gossypium davidsonii]
MAAISVCLKKRQWKSKRLYYGPSKSVETLHSYAGCNLFYWLHFTVKWATSLCCKVKECILEPTSLSIFDTLSVTFWVMQVTNVFNLKVIEGQNRVLSGVLILRILGFEILSSCLIKLFREERMLQWAAKILANLIVMGSGILARAVVQAYRQAISTDSAYCEKGLFAISACLLLLYCVVQMDFLVSSTVVPFILRLQRLWLLQY